MMMIIMLFDNDCNDNSVDDYDSVVDDDDDDSVNDDSDSSNSYSKHFVPSMKALYI